LENILEKESLPRQQTPNTAAPVRAKNFKEGFPFHRAVCPLNLSGSPPTMIAGCIQLRCYYHVFPVAEEWAEHFKT